MAPSPSPWQLNLARVEGALPFLSPEHAECLALASLRRLWRVHVRDYTFESIGIAHDPGLEADELMRSWYADERRQFLSWISRRAPPPLARAARLVMAGKNDSEGFSQTYLPAERALARLDALLPSSDAMSTLAEWLEELRTEEVEFLEGGSEVVVIGGMTVTRPARRGAAWAASLAAAMRPHLFALGSAPLAFAGLMPRAAFRELHEEPLPHLLRSALHSAVTAVVEDLRKGHEAIAHADKALSGLYASSTAPRVWRMIIGLGPATRAEIARGLGITKRTASQSVIALRKAGLVHVRDKDSAVMPASARQEYHE